MSLASKFNKKIKKKIGFIEPENKSPNHVFINRNEKFYMDIKQQNENNKLPIGIIKGLIFKCFSKDTIKKLSVVNIEETNTLKSKIGTLEDPRMGTVESFYACPTCQKTNQECAGHLGVINFQVYFISPPFRDKAIQVLNCYCNTCNKLYITDNIIKLKKLNLLNGEKRLKAISDLSLKLECPNINCSRKPIFIEKKTNKEDTESLHRCVEYYVEDEKKEKKISFMKVETIKKKFDLISDKDAKLLGFEYNHPSNFIVDFIPVIPLNDRIYHIINNMKQEHDLTQAYKLILESNIESFQYEDKNRKEECHEKILKNITTLINNNSGETNISQKEPLKSINDYISKKKGLIRCNMLGKRVNYCGRTVLNPNGKINFGYIGIPQKMENLTIPEIVTTYNYDRIINLAKQGKIFSFSKNNNNIRKKFRFDKDINKLIDKIDFGDKVNRHLENGDYLLFNRQPTLHRLSMLGYEINFHKKDTIGIHLSNTEGHNADFDGDEGNIFPVQTIEAMAEVKFLVNCKNNIINFGKSLPGCGLVFNSLTGIYILAKNNINISEYMYNNCLKYIKDRMKNNYIINNLLNIDDRLKKHNIKKYSTFGLLSILFPPDFSIYKKGISIIDGILVKSNENNNLSSLCKTTYNGIIQILHKEWNYNISSDFISSSNFLANWFILRDGFTIGIKDIMLNDKKYEEFKEKRNKIVNSMDSELLTLEILKDNSDKYKIESRKEIIQKIVSKAHNDINQIFQEKYLNKNENSLNIMVKSGAKGSGTKLYNVVSTKGQIFIGGKLPIKKISNCKRWITSFSIFDNSSESLGFSKNNYFEGINPDAYFAEAEDGRKGVIDKFVNTKYSGYTSRKLVKCMENLIVNYDGSVRNHLDMIFQFSYGQGFDNTKMVLDDTDNGFSKFSFVNIKRICEKNNQKNGFSNYDITKEIEKIVCNINDKYGFQNKEIQINNDYDEEENNEDDYINDDDYIGEDFFDE